MRKDIEFKTDDGVTLRGWFYQPDSGTGPFPTIVMCHGFSATKEQALDDNADVFCAGGFAVLVYDNRNLGASDGPLRGEIDPNQQIHDYRDAITYAITLPEVDSDRIGIWGSSYSGGHVCVVGAIDRRVKCVVSQVPYLAGFGASRRLATPLGLRGLRQAFEADRLARFNGEPPVYLPVVPVSPGDPNAILAQDSAAEWFFGTSSYATTWENLATLRSAEMFFEYDASPFVAQIAPTPFMLVVTADDPICSSDLSLKVFNQDASEPKRVLVLPGEHFAIYGGDLMKRASAAELDWFQEWLMA
ncbi:MAG: alpha/beta hydrolase [Coriobacteriia bacterium]